METREEEFSARRISALCSQNIHIKNFHRCNRLAAAHERMEYHTVFAFLIPVLVALLQIRHQSQNGSPFISNPKRMWAFLLTTTVYCFAFGLRSSERNYSQIFVKIALVSGSLSTASQLSMFLPQSAGSFLHNLWSTAPTMVVCKTIKESLMWVYQKLTSMYSNILGDAKGFTQGNCQEHSPSLALEGVQVVYSAGFASRYSPKVFKYKS